MKKDTQKAFVVQHIELIFQGKCLSLEKDAKLYTYTADSIVLKISILSVVPQPRTMEGIPLENSCWIISVLNRFPLLHKWRGRLSNP